jgi:hypothetical protein
MLLFLLFHWESHLHLLTCTDVLHPMCACMNAKGSKECALIDMTCETQAFQYECASTGGICKTYRQSSVNSVYGPCILKVAIVVEWVKTQGYVPGISHYLKKNGPVREALSAQRKRGENASGTQAASGTQHCKHSLGVDRRHTLFKSASKRQAGLWREQSR